MEMELMEYVLYITMDKGLITKMNHNYLRIRFAPPCNKVTAFSEEGVNHLPSSKEGDF